MYTKKTYEYIEGLREGKPALDPIYQYAIENSVPVMQPIALDFLLGLIRIANPKRILEFGTAIGYSGSKMLSCCDGHLTTIEICEKSFGIAKSNFAAVGMSDRVLQVLGDANQQIDNLAGTFDFIFLDYAKGQYIRLLPKIICLLTKGSILVADNVLYRGYISGEQAFVRRQKTIVKRMQEFLSAISNHEQLQTSILPICDGISVSVKL